MDPYTIEGNASGLSFVDRASLAGPIEYHLSGPRVDLRVVSDFEDGLAYPVPYWECP